MGSNWCNPKNGITEILGNTACGISRGGRKNKTHKNKKYKGGLAGCNPSSRVSSVLGSWACNISRGGRKNKTRKNKTRKNKKYKGGLAGCNPSSRVSSVLGSWACNISRGGNKKKRLFRHTKDYNKCGPLPWPVHTKCKAPMKCSKKIGHPAGIGHGRGSHTCY